MQYSIDYTLYWYYFVTGLKVLALNQLLQYILCTIGTSIICVLKQCL